MDKQYVKLTKKAKVYECAKDQKLQSKNGTFFLEKGDKFVLVPVKSLKEQTSDSEAMGKSITDKINSNLTDAPIEVKVMSDESTNLNGVKTTNITWEVCVKEDAKSELVNINVDGIDFTPEFDAMLNDVLLNEFKFKADEIGADSTTNTFWVMKTEIENMPEVEEVEAPVEMFAGNDDVIMDDYVEDDIYVESVGNYKKSKYVSFVEKKACKESDDIDEEDMDEEDDEDDKEDKKKEEMKKLKKEGAKKDKNGKYPFEKGYIKDDDSDEEDDDKKDDKEDKKDEKKKKESVKKYKKESDDMEEDDDEDLDESDDTMDDDENKETDADVITESVYKTVEKYAGWL